MSETYDAIIIGAGIIGASVGFELAKRGWKTLNVDKLPAAGYGSTANSCAIIRTYYSTLDGSALAYESYFDWHDWGGYVGDHDERGLAVFHETGSLVMKTEANGYLQSVCQLMAELAVPLEHWDAEKIKQRLPFYDASLYGPPKAADDPEFGVASGGDLAGAVFFPRAGYISDPQLASHNVQRAGEAAGGAYLFNAEVREIRRADNQVLGVTLADGGVIDAPVVVNVAGPHSAKINGLAGVVDKMKITTRALKQEVAHVPAPAGVDFGPNGAGAGAGVGPGVGPGVGMVTSDSDIGCYGRPEVGNHILIGSEDPPCDERIWVDPDDYDQNFSDQMTLQVHRYAQRIPSLPIPGQLKGVVDLYDVTEDWIPIYDKSDLGGFYMAIGSSGNQFKNASQAGKMMARLITACENGHDHDHDPVQFHLDRLDRDVSIGFYSRLRAINPDSSFSVLG